MMNNEGQEVIDDPRLGKRAVCLSLLPRVVFGTIQRIERFPRVEYWEVLTDEGMVADGPSTCFQLYEGPDLKTGDRVTYKLDEGGFWEATVLKPHWTFDHLRFVIRVDNDEHAAVRVGQGHIFGAVPASLTKI